jgi:prevent-host-death family protein
MTTISSRDFNQGASRAKKAARNGPVYITERGKPTHVLMTIEDFHRRQGKTPRSLLATLAQPGETADVEFEPGKLGQIMKPADLD